MWEAVPEWWPLPFTGTQYPPVGEQLLRGLPGGPVWGRQPESENGGEGGGEGDAERVGKDKSVSGGEFIAGTESKGHRRAI